jgi:hypothetical protein
MAQDRRLTVEGYIEEICQLDPAEAQTIAQGITTRLAEMVQPGGPTPGSGRGPTAAEVSAGARPNPPGLTPQRPVLTAKEKADAETDARATHQKAVDEKKR